MVEGRKVNTIQRFHAEERKGERGINQMSDGKANKHRPSLTFQYVERQGFAPGFASCMCAL